MSGEEVLPRELTNPVPRRGKWTAEEERYTEKIICKFGPAYERRPPCSAYAA
jgi:hypothetical protein